MKRVNLQTRIEYAKVHKVFDLKAIYPKIASIATMTMEEYFQNCPGNFNNLKMVLPISITDTFLDVVLCIDQLPGEVGQGLCLQEYAMMQLIQPLEFICNIHYRKETSHENH